MRGSIVFRLFVVVGLLLAVALGASAQGGVTCSLISEAHSYWGGCGHHVELWYCTGQGLVLDEWVTGPHWCTEV